ncbi:MAG: pyridoxal phosphate-dependent aminotransferase [Christensenellaceae bacterium]
MSVSKRMSSISPSLTLAISAKAKAMKEAGENVISFGVGEPNFNTPDHIIEAAKVAMDKGYTKYTPSSGLPALRKLICKKLERENGLSYEPSQIVVSNGAKHSIFNTMFALLEEGDEVIIPSPYWVTYTEVVKVCGGVPVPVIGTRENSFKVTAEQVKAAITPKTKLLIVNSPSNPTGAVYTEAELRSLAAVCEEAGLYVMSDEIYEKLIYNDVKPFSIAAVSEYMKEHTIVINGVSKTYAMTGWRIGYLAAPKEIAKAIDSFQSHATSNASSISQYAAIAALEGPEEETQRMVDVFRERRDRMMQILDGNPLLSYVRPEGAFYVMLVVGGLYGKKYRGEIVKGSTAFCTALLEAEKVAAVPGIAFGDDECIRLSYALSMEDMIEGLHRIEKFVSELED